MGGKKSGPLIFPHLNRLSGFIIPGLTAKYLVDSWMRIFNQVTIFICPVQKRFMNHLGVPAKLGHVFCE